MVRRLIRTLLFFFAVVAFPAAMAANVALVYVENTGPYAEFVTTLQERLASSSWKIGYVGKLDGLNRRDNQPDLIVTIGSEALRSTLLEATNTPILATLIPRQTFLKALADHGRNRPRGTTGAVFLDQPMRRVAAFVQALLPPNPQIGLLTSQENPADLQSLRQAAGKLAVDSEEVADDAQLLAAINNLLPRVDALLALPDSNIYKRDNIKSILITAFRHQRPVIAFSKAFVNAGALAAVYSTPAQMAAQTAELLNHLPASAVPLPPPQMAGPFSISINSNVADSLKLSLPSEATLHRVLKADGASK